MSPVVRKALSCLLLVLVNLIPIYGVLCLEWKIFPIMFFYWLESAIVGFYNVLKMISAQGTTKVNIEINEKPIEEWSRCDLIFFFIFHYSIFMAVHVGFIFALFGPADVSLRQIIIASFSLFISHGISYVFNYLKAGEYKEISLGQQMMQPYKRIFLMHFVILFAGFAIKAYQAPVSALILMVILKIAMDLFAHIKEHGMLESQKSKVKSKK